MNKKIYYYKDELNDEFSRAKIIPIVIDEKYKYKHNLFWNILSYVIQNILSIPIKIFTIKHFKVKYIGRKKIKDYKKEFGNNGFFVYGNHTQDFADTIIPSMFLFPKRNFFIVNPENVSMKGMKHLAELLGAIPIPGNIKSTKNFFEIIKYRIKNNNSITIYPEAHIWPYYTGIRNFKEVSFKYPVELNKPSFCFTNTYQKYAKSFRIITYIDGPFFVDEKFNTNKEKQKDLRNRIYITMKERSKNSNIDIIEYKYKKKII